LFRRRLIHFSCIHQLSLANGMHNFNPGNRTTRSPKGFEAQHRAHQPFDGLVVLFDKVVEIFGVPENDRGVMVTGSCTSSLRIIEPDLSEILIRSE
jgi:hypothetical protein